ncbi:hypothetical protein PMO31116_04688 [Pandoraea morbifera]|uniref:Uncharacterized protein n=1 Tax=Pandoraea morbifera TaxID=2508300 RepID=A0A5E4YSP5_9BURK|nr:hypothetical protein [Pandoraea morbifera]VVE51512.1 hypothetical protein PMO31116_04688 [Pandoraea morbifera]
MGDQKAKTFYPMIKAAVGLDSEGGRLTLETYFFFNGNEHEGRSYSLTVDSARQLIDALQGGLELISKQPPPVH